MELILNTFGVALNCDNEGFVVTKGVERQRISVDSISSIQISKGASITSDADLSSVVFDEIKKDLAEVQAMYENSDSILIVPISVNYLESMKIIGQNLDIDIIANKKNTLFF